MKASVITKIEATVFAVVAVGLIGSMIPFSKNARVQVAPEVDQLVRRAVDASSAGDYPAFSSLLDHDLAQKVVPTDLEKMAKMINDHGRQADLFAASFLNLTNHPLGGEIRRTFSAKYILRTDQYFIYNVFAQINLDAQPPNLTMFRVQPMGSLDQLRSYWPAGPHHGSTIGYVTTVVFLLLAVGIFGVWLYALFLVRKTEFRHKWLWALLLFVQILPFQYFLSSGQYQLMWTVNFRGLPVHMFSENEFTPHILLVQIPLGAFVLLYLIHTRRVMRASTTL